MAQALMMNHRGARPIELDELSRIEAPPPTATWFPISHIDVFAAVRGTLEAAGYEIAKHQFSVSHENNRFFAALDLRHQVAEGVSLAVGVRNSTDRTLPISFAVGSRVFICDNLALSAEIVISKKHTRFGKGRYEEGIAKAVGSLRQHADAQSVWIDRLRSTRLSREAADSIILRSYEDEVVNSRQLPFIIGEWRNPSFDAFTDGSAWSLFNCFTTVFGRNRTRLAEAALRSLKLQRLFSEEVIDVEFERTEEPRRHLADAAPEQWPPRAAGEDGSPAARME